MKRLILAFAAVLFCNNAHALTNQQTELCFIPEAVNTLVTKCPPLLSGGTVTEGTDSLTVSGVSVTKTPDSVYYLVHDNSDPFTQSVQDRDRMLRNPQTIQRSTQNEVIGGLQGGSTGLYLTMIAEEQSYEGDPITFGPFDLLVGGTQFKNWNPGLYFSDKSSNYRVNSFDRTSRFHTGTEYLTTGAMAALCQPASAFVKGLLLRVEVGEFYPEESPDTPNPELIQFYDEVTEYLESGACGGIPRSYGMMLDVMSNKTEAELGLCAPHDLVDFSGPIKNGAPVPVPNQHVHVWANNGGRDRCALRVWDSALALQRYEDAWQFLLQRYGGDFLEMATPKGEGAWISISQNNDANFVPPQPYQVLIDIGDKMQGWAPQTMIAFGTNNFQAGQDDLLRTLFKPHMDANGGFGLRWPDTFTPSAIGPKGNVTSTEAGKYYWQFQNDHGMWGEWQIPGNRYLTYDDALNNSVIASYVPTNPTAPDSLFRDTDGTLGLSSPPPNRIYGQTHVAVQVVFAGQGFPVSDLTSLINNPPYNGAWPHFDSTCPDNWVANGMTCRDNQGVVVP